MARSSAKATKATKTRDRQDLVDDLTALRSAVTLLLTKLDQDGGVTDADYSTLAPAALKTQA